MTSPHLLWLYVFALLSTHVVGLTRSSFPKDFVFGVATSATQVEGSIRSDGRGPSEWDHFIQKYPGKAIGGNSSIVAIDSYRRYKEDISAIKDIGVDAYRFSISWTRILPNGSLSGGINQQGIDHYNSLIDELIRQGIEPFVTIMHFDWPEALEKKYGGFLSPSIVNDFKDYAEICFKTFGDRVKNWITINEPLIIAKFGYDLGISPPGRCSDRKFCDAGNSSTEPYIATHNLLLAHATAAKLYKEKYQVKQGGQIGLSLVGQFYVPYSESLLDKFAARRANDFELGWFIEPLVYGDYPIIMRATVKDRLPRFTLKERKLIVGSFDFIGINYYTSRYAKNIPYDLKAPPISFSADQFANISVEKDGVPIGPDPSGSKFIYSYPKGLLEILQFIMNRYANPKVYITENGFIDKRNDSIPTSRALNDQGRIDYIEKHFDRMHQAIQLGVKLKGYFYWSLFDSFEWNDGYNSRYGLYYVDYNNNLTRIPKISAKWYQYFLKM